ncbi:aldo/keto reductase [Gilvibacter sediminis]|uniref:aldo/keto reductase n=1 Tax=Gilvibacter sediminis TaxID=379071 RepID=UPI00234FF656|nr:aldo/keto reductase [Gilvibacter sediminis]MDC7999077.1 aldo/keto reductase [Gilvibacter sediminis]
MQSGRKQLTKDLSFSTFIHGYWRLKDWEYSQDEILNLLQQGLDLGITTIDHADIYGDYECETLFGKALANKSSLRSQLELVSKCGIKLLSEKYPERSVKSYDLSYDHIVGSTEQSLKNLQTDYLDVLLLHRPSPLYDPGEVARAFDHLKQSGKVRYFGVSNFTPQQTQTLQSYLDQDLITNQIEISVNCLEHFDNGNIDYLLEKRMHPMAWSPLAGGKLFSAANKDRVPLLEVIHNIAGELNTDIATIMYAWLLKHPVGIMPIVGSGKIERLKAAVRAQEINLSDEHWFRIYEAKLGHEVA